MSNKIRWGILGAARINQQLMPAIVAANNSELIAIASRRPGAATTTLEQYAPDIANLRLYDDPAELLKDPEIQAVYIPLATEDHAHWTLRAIEHGKHVLCEKPIALSIADIENIESAAKQHQVYVMEGFMYRFHPQHQRIQEIISSGAIGEVRSVRTCFAYPMQPARLYRVDRPINQGGGAMWDIGCYAIHAARFHFGDTKAQAVTALAKHNEHGADISSSGLIDFGDGRYAQFNFSFEHARRAEYEIIGTTGGIKCHNVWAKADEQPVISWQADSSEPQIEKLDLANHFQLEVEHFCACILNKQPPRLSLQDAKDNCAIILAALQSVEQGRTIRLE
ncbi:D-xylose 1-dehydrogenase (NADP+) [Bathymodiolus japonicus methanotrophic gill symbiont]|uniref:Gfo/Idh/MocA family protein n=1 Tax=Bathymodiolus japonicus methanotrophic gill symbiont TaxID=113269 RepID=UPI001B7AC2A9|nr:Gfo/Idh/MocA family oxidoreductase [Bathymodiolus japonicus methanotrophic gill symbiont]GFO72656.1 D-xylose 1-dehydrogenase (NADP+) [Bathymodiolus japonicus methanotrophic gill symbiont]